MRRHRALMLTASLAGATAGAQARPEPRAEPRPELHHVGLNTVDPERAIAWYLRVWPTATRTTVAGQPAVAADMLILLNRVDRPPAGAWRDDLHRAEPQSAFWHIGATTNTTDMAARLRPLGVTHLPLFTSAGDTTTIWRSGLAPYTGTLSAAQLATAPVTPPKDGGFSYVVAPDGVLFEFTGGPGSRDALSHVHLLHRQPLCAANWYVEYLGMTLPPVRDSAGVETARAPWSPCAVTEGPRGWPALEPIGTIRTPSGGVRFGNGAISWYPSQCAGATCGSFAPSRGQALDHVAFSIDAFDATFARIRSAGIKILEPPHPFGETRAFMLEDPDGLAIELVERKRK